MLRKSVPLMLPVGIITISLTGLIIWFILVRLADELTMALRIVIIAATLAVVVLAIAGVIFGLLILWERWQQATERTQQAREETKQKRLATDEYKIRILVQSRFFHNAGPGDQVYQFDALANITTPLHLQPGPINGRYIEPSQDEEERWTAHQLAHARRSQITAGSHGPEPTTTQRIEARQTAQDLLNVLTQEQRLCIDGPSGSGKSSLLRHIVAQKLVAVDQVLLCDLHGSRPKWGSSIDAIGFGEDYEAILNTFQQLEWLHTQRIREIAEGVPERSFPIVLCVIEEVQALVDYCKLRKIDVGHYIRMFLTRTRKTSIDVVVVTQASTVKALGMEGYGKNRDAFAFAKTMGRDGRGHRVEYINEYEESFVFDAPPLWPKDQPVGVNPQKVARLMPAPTAEQYRIIEVLRADPKASDYQVCKEIWGKQGSSYKAKIEEVRRLFGPF